MDRILDPIRRKLFLLIGRAILTAVEATGKTQLVQVTGVKGETISDIEQMQPYGFEHYPKTDTEAVILFQNGNRDQGLVICVHDRDSRPTDLNEGEVCLYDENDTRVHLKNGSELDIYSDQDLSIESKNGEITLDANGDITITSATGKVDLNGNLTVDV